MKIGLITDVHYHPTEIRGTKMGPYGLAAVRQWQTWCDASDVDLRVDLGDKIHETSETPDLALASIMAAVYEGKAEHIMGNHDVYTLSTAQWEAAFNQSFSSRSFDQGGYHLVFFCPDLLRDRFNAYYTFSEAELEWMENDLASTELPTIIFTHVPFNREIYDRTLFNNDPRRPNPLHWSNALAMLEIVRESQTFLVCAGHTHWQDLHVEDDIIYLMLQSATDNMVTHPFPSMAMAVVDIQDTKVGIKVRGRDSVQYKLRRRYRDRIWNAPV